jgi:hypothetical protein
VTQGEEEPDGQRALALADQLAGGVVDRRDVVGVERVPHAQRVGQRPGTDPEDRRLADLVVAAERGRQHHPARHVQPGHRRDHAAQAGPLSRAQPLPDLPQTAPRISH